MTESDRRAAAPLFTPFEGGGLRLRNRVVMAPMTRRMAPDDRVPNEEIAAYYARRAAGGVGLILTEGVHIDDAHAPDTPNVPGLFTPAQGEGWARVVRRVHEAGGAIAAQLWHTGRHAMDPIGPSPIPARSRDGSMKAIPREMNERDMLAVRDAFVATAERAMGAGFDAVEIHGAHGYLLDSFVAPDANHRRDAFGGSLANRMRFPLEVVRAVREALGPDAPILYRFSQWKVDDAAAISFPDPDALAQCLGGLRDAGVSILHASTQDATAPAFDGSPRTLSGWTRSISGLPTVAVGAVTLRGGLDEAEVVDPAPAAALVADGEADLVAVGRALIPNPDWCEKVRDGRWRELRPYDRSVLGSLD
jgi:2,4-dienoyl-CoA reductase-like NADH-dependent reductase (Old Yellow Enzyme family)